MPQLNRSLERIKEASSYLHYISESDSPFEVVQIPEPISSLQEELIKLSSQSLDSVVETITLDQFFRPMVAVYDIQVGFVQR